MASPGARLPAIVGGRIDAAMMRFVDIVYALPYVFIVIILASLFERGSIAALFIAIGAVGWLTMARIVRGQTLSCAGGNSSTPPLRAACTRPRSCGATSCRMSPVR